MRSSSRATASSRPRAPASACTVRRWGPRECPRSMYDSARTLTPAVCANSSWLRPASVRRRCRSVPKPPSTGVPLSIPAYPLVSAVRPKRRTPPAKVCTNCFCRRSALSPPREPTPRSAMTGSTSSPGPRERNDEGPVGTPWTPAAPACRGPRGTAEGMTVASPVCQSPRLGCSRESIKERNSANRASPGGRSGRVGSP